MATFAEAAPGPPNYGAAYAGLADCYNMLVVYGRLKPKEGFPKAKEAATRALEIDESSAEAHTSMAFIKFRWDWDRPATEREFQEAIRLKPGYAPAHQWYSSYLVAVERFDEAIAEAKRTQELEELWRSAGLEDVRLGELAAGAGYEGLDDLAKLIIEGRNRVPRLIEHAARLAEDGSKLSVRVRPILDVMREAETVASIAGQIGESNE